MLSNNTFQIPLEATKIIPLSMFSVSTPLMFRWGLNLEWVNPEWVLVVVLVVLAVASW